MIWFPGRPAIYLHLKYRKPSFLPTLYNGFVNKDLFEGKILGLIFFNRIPNDTRNC